MAQPFAATAKRPQEWINRKATWELTRSNYGKAAAARMMAQRPRTALVVWKSKPPLKQHVATGLVALYRAQSGTRQTLIRRRLRGDTGDNWRLWSSLCRSQFGTQATLQMRCRARQWPKPQLQVQLPREPRRMRQTHTWS